MDMKSVNTLGNGVGDSERVGLSCSNSEVHGRT